jgi:FkbM family methyltransferase
MNPKPLRQFVKNSFKAIGYDVKRLTGNEEQNAFEVQGLLTHQKPRVIFDEGAYIGVVSSRYHEMFPNAILHAFEPFPESYTKLKQNVGDSNFIILHNTAISNTEGKLVLDTNPFNPSNSIFQTDPMGIMFWGQDILGTVGQTQVESTTIDAFCEKNAISQIDILKMVI